MNRAWIPLVLLAGTASADPIPEGADINPDPQRAAACGCELPGPPRLLAIHGTVFLKSSGEPAAGATIVVITHGSKPNEVFTAISDEKGEWKVDAPPGIYDITMYYLETTLEVAADRMVVNDLVVGPVMLDDTRTSGWTCWDFGPHVLSPEYSAMPHFGGTFSRTLHPISRDRTHRAWISPIAFADPSRAATTVEGGRRFTGSPGIPTAFIDEVTTHTINVPIEFAQGGGGASSIALRYGSNERRSEARLVLGGDAETGASGGAETFAGGPIVKDHLWAAAGLVTRREGGELGSDGMLRVDANTGETHEVSLTGLAHALGDERAGWTNARWKARLFEAKLEVGAIANAELLDQPRDLIAREIVSEPDPAQRIDRAGGLGFAKLRFRARGYHTLYASAGAGIGRRDGTRHTDASYVIGDDWMPKPWVTIVAGVRTEQRTLGTERAVIVAPRASITWDPTKEGRSELFVAYQRVPLVDDGLPGDWKSLDTLVVDEVSTGIGYRRPTGQTAIGIAARAREDRWGGEAWLRRDSARSVIHVQATSLDRVATVLAQRKLRDRSGTLVTAGASARVGADHSEGGVALGWKRSGGRTELTTELAAEAYAGTAGPGGRMLLGILW